MYNKKSKLSAILTIVSAIFVIGIMVLLPFLLFNTELEGLGAPIVMIFSILFGYIPLYAGGIPFVVVGLIFGIKMLKQQSRKKLISLNVRMLITTCVLLPFIAFGLATSRDMLLQSALGLFPIIYAVVTALAYIACLIAQIVTVALLKKSPEESEPTVTE